MSRISRIRLVTILGAAFIAGAIAIFATVNALGTLFNAGEMPAQARLGLAGSGLLALAAIDLLAIRKSTHCPLGWRRQTPRILMRRYRVDVVSALWGFDTGLAVTTIRVAAVTWGALLLVSLGFSPWWAGMGYGLGFALPLTVLIWVHRAGRSAREPLPTDPGLESMLGNRTALQGVSAVLLFASGWILLGGIVA